LWIAEGFTAYYQDIMVRRTNLYPPENYLNVLANNINIVENQPGNKIQTLSDASFDAWIKLYRPNENSYNTTISYYNKGSVMALLLDLDIIQSSNGKYSLDDVMKYMYTQYYKLKKRGYTDQEFKQGFEKFAGHNYDEFYKNYINGLTAINYNKYLGYAGYKLVDELEGNNDPALGINTSKATGKLMVTTVVRNGSAWVAGVSVNDEITAIDGKTLPENGNLLEGKKVGDKVTVGIIRDAVPMTITVELQKKNDIKYKVESLSSPDEGQLAVRKKWLKL
jgi:predicted metalloprotease with PDZ domain